MHENQTSSNLAVSFCEPRKGIKDDILMSTNRLIRLKEVLSLIPVSSSTWWEGIRTGKFPKAIKISKNISAWRIKDILLLIDQLCEHIESTVDNC